MAEPWKGDIELLDLRDILNMKDPNQWFQIMLKFLEGFSYTQKLLIVV